MNLYLKIMLILFGLAYLISPVDLIPDILLPYVGWLDDGLVLFTIFHLIRHGELPWFLFKKTRGNQKPPGNKASGNNRFTPGQTAYQNGEKNKANPNGSRNESSSAKSNHEILGVPTTATEKEIHTAYKEKIKQYHPDKVSHLGEEFSDLANEKFLEIQKAYDALKKQR